MKSKLLPEKLESFFISWSNRIPQKSLSFIIICNDSITLISNNKIMQIIKEYIELGIIEEFKTIDDIDDFTFIRIFYNKNLCYFSVRQMT